MNESAHDRATVDLRDSQRDAVAGTLPDPATSGQITQEANTSSLGERPTPVLASASTEVRSSTSDWPRPASGQIGSWQLIEELKPGGMGRVFKARHLSLGHVAAVKTIRAEAGEDESCAIRFQREAQAVANLRHPHIVSLHDYGEHEGQRYFSMEFAASNLAAERQHVQSDTRLAVTFMEKICRAVHHAHLHGIVHRDLKPANVLVSAAGEPLVSDFGLAKFATADVDLTRQQAILGTPAYMSPEQAAGRSSEVTPASDVWSLGVMLFEFLTGQRPFAGKNDIEVRRHILQADPPSPRSLNRKIDRGLEAVTLKCLEKDAARRYQNAGELGDQLARWLRHEPIDGEARAWPVRAWRWSRRHRVASATVALVVVASVALAALYLSDPERSREADQARLRNGLAVTYVNDVGQLLRPKSARDMGAATSIVQTVDAPTDCTHFLSAGVGLIELCADPPRGGFRFRAHVLHERGDVDTKVGLYFGRKAGANGKQAIITWAFHGSKDLSFSVPRGITPSQVWHSFEVYDPQRSPPPATRDLVSLPLDPPGVAWRGRQWRDLEIELTPQMVRLRWDGKEQRPIFREELSEQSKDLLKSLSYESESGLNADGRGGLGLYVDRSMVALRSVVLEPLPPAK